MKKINLIERLFTDSHEKQRVHGMRRYAAMLLLLLSCATHAWANDASGARIYYDNTTSQWSYVQLLGGHGTWSSGTALSLISGTNNLWTNTWSWGGYTYFMFIDASGTWGGEDHEAWERKGYASHYSKTFSTNVGSNTYLYTSTSTTDGTGPTETSITGYSALNYEQKIFQCVSNNGGAAAKSTADIATISIETKELTSADETDDSEASISSGNNSCSTDAARTATVTMTVTDIDESNYAWLGWYDAESGGTRLEASQTYTYNATAAKTVYARFSHETSHTVAVTYKCTQTNANVKSAENPAIGEVTTQTFTAGTPKGYSFTSWSIGNGLYVTSGSSSTNSITVKTLSSGTYTLQANYDEVLTTDWYLLGNNTDIFPGSSTWTTDDDNMLAKASGYSTSDEGSLTISVSALPANNDSYQFKVFNDAGDHWWGWTKDGHYYVNSSNHTGITLVESTNNNCYFIPNILGDYKFTVDWSGASPVLSVAWPTAYTVNFGYREGGSSVTATYSGTSFDSGTKVQSGKSVTFTYSAASGYEFAGWYNASTGGTKVSSSDSYTTTISGATTIYAAFTPITYTNVTLDKTTGSTDGKYSVTYKGTSLTVTTTPAKTGYEPEGYYRLYNSGTGVYTDKVANSDGSLNAKTTHTNSDGQWVATTSPTLYTKWQAKTYTGDNNLDKNGGDSHGKYTATYNATTIAINTTPLKSGYHVDGYYKEAGLTNLIATSAGALQSGTAYTDASSHWTNDGNVTLHTKWAPNNYTITFNGNNGSRPGTPSNIQATVTVTYDDNNFNVSSTPVSTVAIPVLAGYTFGGYYTDIDGGGTQIVAANGAWIVPGSGKGNTFLDDAGNWVKAANTTVYAKWTENNYTVTVEAGEGGSVGSTSVTGHVSTLANLPTATPSNGYYFVNWTTTAGTLTNSTSATTGKINGLTSDATVTANFAKIYYLKGSKTEMGSWSTENDLSYAGSANTYSVTLTLAAKTEYEFKIYNRQTSAVYGASSTSFTRASYSKTGLTTEGGNTYNIHITTDAAGDYTFTYVNAASVGSMQVSVGYPTAYTVTFGSDGHASSVTATASATGTLTSGDYVGNGETVTFAQTPNTGYSLKGWYTTVDGSTSAGLNGSSQITVNADKTVYAQYNANTYAVTFDYATNSGSKTSGNDQNNATYDQATITTPVVYKNGYCLDGWYSAASSGTKVINADGTFVENVSISDVQWTDGDGKWKKLGTATVYAVFVAPDTIMLNPDPETLNAFAAQHSGKDTLALAPSFNCDPTGNWHISYMVGYSENHTLLEPQPTIIYGTGANVGKDSIKMPYNANTYEIISILRTGTTQGSGTEIMRDTSKYIVEDMYSVKAHRIVDGIDITEPAAWSGYPSSRKTSVSAPLELNGYVLDYWELGVGIDTVSGEGRRDASYETKQIYAHNNGTVRLHYKPKPNTVYFMDGFDMYWYSTKMKMYDYGTSTGYWNDGYGADSHDSKVGDTVKMASHGTPEVMMMAIGSSSTNFAITNKRMDNYGHFHGASEGNEWARVIYRTDFNGATSMFVPVSKEPRPVTGSDFLVLNTTETGAAHYYRGFWVKYSPNRDSTGYYLHVYNQVAQAGAKTIQTLPLRLTQTGEGDTWELTAKMDLEANKTYGFKITKATGASTKTWYSYNGTLTAADHEGKVLDGTTNNIGLTTTSAGDYTFHVFCKAVTPSNPITASDVQGQLAVTVDYAAVSGDYRVIYSDATQTEVIASPSIHPRENGQDTVSFFIRKNAASRVMKIQKFTSDWSDSCTIDLSDIAKDSVYVLYLQQSEGKLTVTGKDFYNGDYYIRTDCVDEHKWDYKQSLDNHRMNPSDYGMASIQPVKFTHYYAHWIDEGGNVKCIVANKYAPCLSDTLITDTYANGAGGCLPTDGDAGTNIGANVRFMYNKGTNAVTRAYLAGAQGVAYDPNFLKLSTFADGSHPTKMKNTSNDDITNITFSDEKNWIYQAAIKAQPGLSGKLTAAYNSNTQYFIGAAGEGAKGEEQLLGGTGSSWQNILLTYDFKVNRLICAWQPGDTITGGNTPINADVMVIRTGQNDADQIIFKTNNDTLSEVKYIYSVMQFNHDDMVGHMYTWGLTAYQYCMYYISFPYDVLVNDIMAPGRMGSEWRLQRYNGAKRAADGWFAGDGVTTFWEDVQSGDTLHAYEGYSLLLNRRIFNDGSSTVWQNKGTGSKLYMYFPSMNATTGIVANKDVTITVPSHQCEKDVWFTQDYYAGGSLKPGARNHKVVDSHWNMIGTPLFEDKKAATITTGPTIEGKTLQYIYAWNPAGNTLGIEHALNGDFEFKTMYSYMAQYTGTITFTGSAINSVVAAPRRTPQKKYTMNLELTNGDDFIGRTYVELRENAVDTFLLNEDVYMVKNGVNADLYTFAGAYEAGANVLSVDNHIVPVGVDVKAAGTYTFSMPDNFDGEVILVDNYTQTRTNLMIEDYEIALPKATITDRFYIEININKVSTAIDGVEDGSLKDGKAHKFIMNDQMYILKDGEMFDARGNRVK